MRWTTIGLATLLVGLSSGYTRAACPANTETDRTALHDAARACDVTALNAALADGCNADDADSKGWTPMLEAALAGCTGALTSLHDAGARLDAGISLNNLLFRPIHLATVRDHADVVRWLLAHDVDRETKLVSLLSSRFWRPLHIAAENNARGAATVLLDAGADRNACGGAELPVDGVRIIDAPEKRVCAGATPAVIAARVGSLGVLEELLDRGVSVDEDRSGLQALAFGMTDPSIFPGLTPLGAAAQMGKLDVVELLLAKGAKLDGFMGIQRPIGADSRPGVDPGATALVLAAMAGHAHVVHRLLAAGADHNTRVVIAHPSGLGPDGSLQTKRVGGHTALHLAAFHGHADVVDALLDAGADVDAINGFRMGYMSGMTPLFFAAAGGHATIVDRLLARGANPDGTRGVWHPISAAIQAKCAPCAALLVQAGAAVTDFDRDNAIRNPALRAALRGQPDAWRAGLAPRTPPPRLPLTSRGAREPRRVLQVPPFTMFATAAISPDGALVALGYGEDVQLWDANSGLLLRTLHFEGASSRPRLALAFIGPRRLAVACERAGKTTLWLRDFDAERQRVIFSDADEFQRLKVGTDGRMYVAMRRFGSQGTVVSLDPDLPKVQRKVPVPLDRIWDIAVDPARQVVYAAGESTLANGQREAQILAIDTRKNTVRWSQPWGEGRVFRHVTTTHDGRHLAIVGDRLELWRTSDGVRRWRADFESWVVAPHPSRPLLLSPKLKEMSNSRGELIRVLANGDGWRIEASSWPGPRRGRLSALQWSADGNRLLAVSSDGVMLLDLSTGHTRALQAPKRVLGTEVALSRTGKLAIPMGGYIVDLARLRAEAIDARVQGNFPVVPVVVADPTSSRLYFGGSLSVSALEDEESLRQLRFRKPPPVAFELKNSYIMDLDLSPDGRWLVGATAGDTIWTMDTKTFEIINTFKIPARGIGSMEASPKRIVVIGETYTPQVKDHLIELRNGRASRLSRPTPGGLLRSQDHAWTLSPSGDELAETIGGAIRITDMQGSERRLPSARDWARYSPSGAELAIAASKAAGPGVQFFDARTWAARCTANVPGLGVARHVAAVWSADGKWFMVGHPGEAGLHFIDAKQCRFEATFFAGQDGDWLLVLASGEYAASRRGTELVAYDVGHLAIFARAFDLELNRPDIVAARLGYATPKQLARLREVVARRLRRHGLDGGRASTRRRGRPTVTVQRRFDPAGFEDLTIESSRDGRAFIEVDGVPLSDLKGRRLRRRRAKLRVPLAPGRNQIRVTVADGQGRRSLPVEFTAVHAVPDAAPVLYVASIGVADYRDDRLDLRNAAKDAKDVAATFAKQARFADVRTLVQTDADVKDTTLRRVRRFFSRARPGDAVILHLAGHGFVDDRGRYFFAIPTTDRKRLAQTAWTFEEIEQSLDGLTSRRRLILMDTCHSGALDDAAAGRVEDDGAYRGFQVEVSDHEVERLRLMERFADLRSNSGTIVLAAASVGEFARDGDTGTNGLFSAAIIDALDGFGELTTRTLEKKVVEYVRKKTGGAQRPVVRQDNPDLVFRLR